MRRVNLMPWRSFFFFNLQYQGKGYAKESVGGELRNRRIDIASGKRQNLVICSITKEDNLRLQKDCAKWDEACGEKATPKTETMHEK